MTKLDDAQVESRLAPLTGWKRTEDEITKSFKFKSFPTALEFVHRVGEAAEKANHHPDIDIRYDTVTLRLSTHDAGGLTERDFELAGVVQGLVGGGAGGTEGSSPGNPLV